MELKKNRKGLQVSFGWLFGIIVGAVILFLAIYLVTKIVGVEETELSAETAKEIGVLLNPLETGFESASSTKFSLASETRIYNRCENYGNFGFQKIGVSQKSFDKGSDVGIESSFENKYIFSNSVLEGKEFYVFSKPFEFPFKVADLIYMTSTSKDYCFLRAPEEIEKELNDTKQKNFKFENCADEDIVVCFSGSCDVKINTELNYVQKENEKLYFETDALMYAAIFSDKNTYECQVKRLMKRCYQLTDLYEGKAYFISGKCGTDLGLIELSNELNNFAGSSDLSEVYSTAEEIDRINEFAQCKLW